MARKGTTQAGIEHLRNWNVEKCLKLLLRKCLKLLLRKCLKLLFRKCLINSSNPDVNVWTDRDDEKTRATLSRSTDDPDDRRHHPDHPFVVSCVGICVQQCRLDRQRWLSPGINAINLLSDQNWWLSNRYLPNHVKIVMWDLSSVTRLGDLLDFRQLFKACVCPNLPHS